ncbi:MAG: DUF4860 domain-containing protein [Eubacterium sp.]|nr:DUF4860 domain-containing protein [Eubacterium sp.]
MRRKTDQKHNIEGAFVLVLFAIFAITVIAVLALGANSYQRLVARDNDAYNRRIITSYVAAKIRSSDAVEGVAVGGFVNPKSDDGVNTLHLYQELGGDVYDQRIYFYEGKVYEILAVPGSNIKPEDGNAILDAQALSFDMQDGLVNIRATDTEGRENHVAVSVRSQLDGARSERLAGEDSGGVG